MRKLCLTFLLLGFMACTYPTYTTVAAPEPDPVVTESEPVVVVPPAPVLIPDKWAIYVIDCKDNIILEDHCEVWQAWPSRTSYRYDRGEAFRLTADGAQPPNENLPWRYVHDYIWYPVCGL